MRALAEYLLAQGVPASQCNVDIADVLPIIPDRFSASESGIQPEQSQYPYITPVTHVPANTFDPFSLPIPPEASGEAPSSHFLRLPDIRNRLLDCKKRVFPVIADTIGCRIQPETDAPDASGNFGLDVQSSPLESREDDIQLALVIEGVVLGLSIMTHSLGSRVIWGSATDPMGTV